jgi:hypothetical protein
VSANSPTSTGSRDRGSPPGIAASAIARVERDVDAQPAVARLERVGGRVAAREGRRRAVERPPRAVAHGERDEPLGGRAARQHGGSSRRLHEHAVEQRRDEGRRVGGEPYTASGRPSAVRGSRYTSTRRSASPSSGPP